MKQAIVAWLILCFCGVVYSAAPGLKEIAEQHGAYIQIRSDLQQKADSIYMNRESNPEMALSQLEHIARQVQEVDRRLSGLQAEKDRIAQGFGCIHGKCLNGKGTYVYPDGSSYNGHFSNGKLHGSGKYSLSEGKIFSGNWREGVLEGKCTVTSSGVVFSGNCSQESGRIRFLDSVKIENVPPPKEPEEKSWWDKNGKKLLALSGAFFIIKVIFPFLWSLFSGARSTPEVHQETIGHSFSPPPIGSGNLRSSAPAHSQSQSIASRPNYTMAQERERLRGVIGRVREGNMDGKIQFEE